MNRFKTPLWTAVGTLALAALLLAPAVSADQLILDDLIVDGSICVGQDCVNGESFGFDTLRLKENNLRIKFQDTSNSASFPTNDWQITANDSSNGGANKFSIDDIDGGRTPFTIEAGAPSHSLFVDDGGRIGFGTNTPVVDLHVKSGNTPTLRLEQDGSSGFTAQTWDVAGNEANFFIRDATNGSTLPFRIEPGVASNAVYLENTEQVGINTSSPDATLEVAGTATSVGPGNAVLKLVNVTGTGDVALQLDAADDGQFWNIAQLASNNNLQISAAGTGAAELILTTGGDLTLTGNCADAMGGDGCTADFVFEPDYELMPLEALAEFVAENKHLPNVPAADETRRNGLNLTTMNGRLLEKIEELVLYTIEQQEAIDELRSQVESLQDAE